MNELDTLPELTPVESGNIKAIGHSGDMLIVQFKQADGSAGPTWGYQPAAKAAFDSLKTAKSIGKHFATYVRNNSAYKGHKIADAPKPGPATPVF